MLKEVTIPIYDALLILSVDKKTEELTRCLNEKFHIKEKPSDCKGFVNNCFSPPYDTNVFYMYIMPTNDKKEYWNSIAHELFHLTQDILESRDSFFKRRDANEAYAYLQGYLMSENFEFWEKAYNKYKVKK